MTKNYTCLEVGVVMSRCLLCGEEKETGIVIGGYIICTSCEKALTITDPEKNEYSEVVKKLRPLSRDIIEASLRD